MSQVSEQTAIVIGAGPAGLTSAYELLKRTNIEPVVYELDSQVGGISKTIDYKGNMMDIGGHRFFSKSDTVMGWWLKILPLQGKPARDDVLLGRTVPVSEETDAPDPEETDRVMLIRNRLSQILYQDKLLRYPLAMNLHTLASLGPIQVARIVLSYLKTRMLPIREEASLEDFFINRFGRALYQSFFKDYTEKVWGVGCNRISPEWGAQRIKGLSVSSVLTDAIRSIFPRDSSIGQKGTQTSLIKRFLYPKLGPGQLWETVQEIICEKETRVHLRHKVKKVLIKGDVITGIEVVNLDSRKTQTVSADYYFCTMPAKEFIRIIYPEPPQEVRHVAESLIYRSSIVVGLLLKKLKIEAPAGVKTLNGLVPYNWIYVQDKNVKLGRIQVFNNWSPYLVKDPSTVWIGLEYFCTEGDELWRMPESRFAELAIGELARIGVADEKDVFDSMVVHASNTYPAYYGGWKQFDVIRKFTDSIRNLFLIGRNSMHRYNNQDHSMLAAMTAVDNIVQGINSRDNIWAINTEAEYHEQK